MALRLLSRTGADGKFAAARARRNYSQTGAGPATGRIPRRRNVHATVHV